MITEETKQTCLKKLQEAHAAYMWIYRVLDTALRSYVKTPVQAKNWKGSDELLKTIGELSLEIEEMIIYLAEKSKERSIAPDVCANGCKEFCGIPECETSWGSRSLPPNLINKKHTPKEMIPGLLEAIKENQKQGAFIPVSDDEFQGLFLNENTPKENIVKVVGTLAVGGDQCGLSSGLQGEDFLFGGKISNEKIDEITAATIEANTQDQVDMDRWQQRQQNKLTKKFRKEFKNKNCSIEITLVPREEKRW